MPPSDDPEVARIREFGKIIAPYVVIHIATALTAARYNGPSAMPSSQDWRTGVITDSVKDALHMMKLVLG
jgi:hypothetical protein